MPLTLEDLGAVLKREAEYIESHWNFRLQFDRRERWLLQILGDLEAMGLAERVPVEADAEMAGIQSWKATLGNDRDRPPGGEPPFDPPPEIGRGGDDEDGGGRGIREVLSHPYLFSMDDEDFNDAIDRALYHAG
ncbi:MAG: hypothetical protein RXR20_14990 [Paraburkholderia sp.]|uniref:hypothetical protein n=1 Tax=Paraburkholderia sp. TaxID=1926495 RepID=UPI0039786207